VSTQENMALVRRFFQARAEADLDAMDKMMAPGFISHPLFEEPDREGYKRQVAGYVAAFSNVSILIEDQVAAGDKVTSRITGRATHDRKELLGAAPTGREVSYMAILIHRIEGGKIAEEWGVGTAPSELMGERLEQEISERARVERELEVARSIQQASLPEEVPELEDWRIDPFYQPAREVGGDFYDFHLLPEGKLGSWWGTPPARGCPLPWSCQLPAACCSPPLEPWAPLRPVRYWPRSTRRWSPASLPTCSSPASMPSSSPRAAACGTPTRATTRPTCAVATTMPRS
jgi:predicted ester cyclase